jgi:hypothetical protein
MIARKLCATLIAAVCINLKTAAHAAPCYEKAHLEAFLKREHGLKLHSWGVNGAGNMVELWLASNGLFALVTTTPDKCTTVEIPADLRGRLWTPSSPNKAIPEADRMNKGDKL